MLLQLLVHCLIIWILVDFVLHVHVFRSLRITTSSSHNVTELLRVCRTTLPLFDLSITGKSCRKSPLTKTLFPLNFLSLCCLSWTMSLMVRSKASKHSLFSMGPLSKMASFIFCKNLANSDCDLMLQYDSLGGVNGSLNWLCDVLPRCNKVAAMPELADVATLSPFIRIQLMTTFNVKVFRCLQARLRRSVCHCPFQ